MRNLKNFLSAAGLFLSLSAPAGAETYTVTPSGGSFNHAAPQGTMTVTIPPGAFASNVTMDLNTPPSFPAAGSTKGILEPLGFGVDITVTPAVQPAANLTVTVNYRTQDVPCGCDETKLALARFDTVRGLWVPLPTFSDPGVKRIVAITDKLGLFQVMLSSPTQNTDQATAFPNPMRPPRGDSSITFTNLPANSKVRVYTLMGEKLRELDTLNSGSASWDGKNADGSAAASGIYYVHIKPETGNSKTLKVAIQR